jgi:sugar lactone lactonase YvrE
LRAATWIAYVFVACGLDVCGARADLFATGHTTIYQYSDTGAYKRSIAGSEEWVSVTVGPDAHVYAASNILGWGSIIRIDPVTGQFTEVVPFDPSYSAKYTIPFGLAFDPDGSLFAGSNRAFPNFGTTGILRVNSTNGEMELFASPADPDQRITDIAFGPDRNLYVAVAQEGIVRVNGMTGQTMDLLNTSWGSFSFDYFGSRMAFGPDGKLYLSDSAMRIHRMDPADPDAHELFIAAATGGVHSVNGMTFGADGNLYVASGETRQILRFDGTTGTFIDVFTSDARDIRPYRWDIAHIPEPDTLTLSALGAVLLAYRRKGQRLSNISSEPHPCTFV